MHSKPPTNLARPRRATIAAAVVCAAAFACVIALHPHPHFGFDGVVGFHALLGAGAVFGLAALGRLLSAALGRDDPPDGEEDGHV